MIRGKGFGLAWTGGRGLRAMRSMLVSAAWFAAACGGQAAEGQIPTVGIASTARAASTAFELRAMDVDLGALILGMSDILGHDVVLGPGFGSRTVSVDQRYESWEAFLEALRQGAAPSTLWFDGTPVLGGGCMQQARVSVGKGFDGKSISLNFQNGELNLMLGYVQAVASPGKFPTVPPLQPLLPVSVRLRDATVGKALTLLATAGALDASLDDDGSLRYHLPAERHACFKSLPEGASPLSVVIRDRPPCPAGLRRMKNGKEVPAECDPLERYKLDEIKLRAIIRIKDRSYALAEGRDGLLVPLRMGHYAGTDFGKVTRIDWNGVQLREIKLDADGVYQESAARLSWPAAVPAVSAPSAAASSAATR